MTGVQTCALPILFLVRSMPIRFDVIDIYSLVEGITEHGRTYIIIVVIFAIRIGQKNQLIFALVDGVQ